MPTEPKTDWTDVPDLDEHAVVIGHKHVRDANVVHLLNASIRSSVVSGIFLVDGDPEIFMWRGKPRILVQCLWYGRKPPTTWMHITCGTEPRFESNYNGPVIWNIGR
jgi:hypothetical protein